MLKNRNVISKTRVRIIRGYHGTPDKWLHIDLTPANESKQPNKTLIFDDCQYVHFYKAEVEGFTAVGHPLKGKDFGIETRACHSVNLVSPKMLGAPDDATKDAWLATVGNGIKTHADCADITIINPTIDSIHVGICAMGENTRVEKGSITRFSGDDIQMVNHGCEAIGVKLAWFLRVLPYAKWHGDFVQVFWPDSADRTYFKGIKIKNCHMEAWENKTVHKWCSSPDQVTLISDGMADGAEFVGNTIYTDCPIVLLSNPCINSLATDNDIYVTLPTQAKVGIVIMTFDDDRKNYGCSPKNNIVDDNRQHLFNPDVRSIILASEALHADSAYVQEVKQKVSDGELVEIVGEAERVGPGIENYFTREVTSLANVHAEAVTDEHYDAAAKRLSISLRMIKAVGIVESRGDGYNSDGSLKSLYERHINYKLCKKAGYLKEAQQELPADLINRRTGGYKGGTAEYIRAEEAYLGLEKVFRQLPWVSPDRELVEFKALDTVLQSKSWGRWQIMGFNHALAGFETPIEMVRAFHESEVAQLDGFVSFLQNTGLVKHLRDAEALLDAGKNPRPALNKFAIGYNGKKHKNYDAKIAAEYRKLSPDPVEFDSMVKSRITVASATSIVTTTGAIGTVVAEMSGVLEKVVEKKDEIAETVSAVKDNVGTLKDGAEALKDSASNVVASAGNDHNWLLWLLLALLIISNLGSIMSLWARFTDRWAGKN
jgi:hypothetical protein